MKGFLILIASIIFIGVLMRISFPIRKSKVFGKYVNRNFHKLCGPEISDKPDTLYLKKGNLVSSQFYGNGTFTLKGNRIDLLFTKDGGFGMHTNMANFLFHSYRIELNYDLNCYYEKID